MVAVGRCLVVSGVMVDRWMLLLGGCCRRVSLVVSGVMVDRRMLLLVGCCRQVSIVVSLIVWWTGGCYCKMAAEGR